MAFTKILCPVDFSPGSQQALRTAVRIMGSHGHTGIARMVLGSVAEQVVRHARCPVLVAHGNRVAPD
jgi:universal stress protein family protein